MFSMARGTLPLGCGTENYILYIIEEFWLGHVLDSYERVCGKLLERLLKLVLVSGNSKDTLLRLLNEIQINLIEHTW